jgi:HlyD family secretion protein
VPERDRIIAEVQVQPNDIDVVHTDLQAEVRLPLSSSASCPTCTGT